tara:strand:+ start:1989 stop:2483 length:495 start_codon:yes stop_codon:yes gene_type:complete
MIHEIKDFLPRSLLEKIRDQFFEDIDWETSTRFWSKALYEYDGNEVNPCFVGKSSFKDYNEGIADLVSRLSRQKVGHVETLMYRWTPGSCILWHDDHGHDANITFYVSEWDRNWGGELMLEDGRWIAPEQNKLVIFLEQIPHKTTLRLPNTPERLTLQTFVKYE